MNLFIPISPISLILIIPGPVRVSVQCRAGLAGGGERLARPQGRLRGRAAGEGVRGGRGSARGSGEGEAGLQLRGGGGGRGRCGEGQPALI